MRHLFARQREVREAGLVQATLRALQVRDVLVEHAAEVGLVGVDRHVDGPRPRSVAPAGRRAAGRCRSRKQSSGVAPGRVRTTREALDEEHRRDVREAVVLVQVGDLRVVERRRGRRPAAAALLADHAREQRAHRLAVAARRAPGRDRSRLGSPDPRALRRGRTTPRSPGRSRRRAAAGSAMPYGWSELAVTLPRLLAAR